MLDPLWKSGDREGAKWTPEGVRSPAGFKAGQTVFTTTTVKLRETPDASSDANLKDKFPGGTAVTILGESQNAGGFIWWKVRVGSQEGWMAQAAGNTVLLSLT